jgi:hypothetical protein
MDAVEGTFWVDLSRAADFTTIVAIVVTGLSVLLALRQLRRTENAEEAAERARRDFRREANLRQLVAFLPSLKKIENELSTAVREAEGSAVERWLSDWIESGSKLKGMLAGQPSVPSFVIQDLATSITQAATAKVRLGDSTANIGRATERARDAIQMAGVAVADLSGRLNSFVEEEEGEEESEE